MHNFKVPAVKRFHILQLQLENSDIHSFLFSYVLCFWQGSLFTPCSLEEDVPRRRREIKDVGGDMFSAAMRLKSYINL